MVWSTPWAKGSLTFCYQQGAVGAGAAPAKSAAPRGGGGSGKKYACHQHLDLVEQLFTIFVSHKKLDTDPCLVQEAL